MRVSFTIHGQAASKANSRRLVFTRGRARSIKSDAALQFERDALYQIPQVCRVMYAGPVRVTLRMFYRNERPDLDESLVLDALQARYSQGGKKRGELVRRGVIENDRQVREKHIYHGIDRVNPRVVVLVESLLVAMP